MRKIYEEHQQALGAKAGRSADETQWRRAHLARAKPVAQMNHLVRTSILMGSEVRNLSDDRLGEIGDLIFNPKEREVLYALVSRGGFLGIGGKLVAVPWSDLRATEDLQLYVLNVPPKVLDEAPTIDRQTFMKAADPDWQSFVSQYWDRALKQD
jgi:hypothetical protein